MEGSLIRKSKLSRWIWNPMMSVLVSGTRRHREGRGEKHVKTSRYWGDSSNKPRTMGVCRVLGWHGCFHLNNFRISIALQTPCSWDLGSQNCQRIINVASSHQIYDYFLQKTQDINANSSRLTYSRKLCLHTPLGWVVRSKNNVWLQKSKIFTI